MATRLQATGNKAGGVTSVSKAFTSDVTAGSLVIIMGATAATSNRAMASGDCTKTAGTSTISSITLHQELVASISGGYYGPVGIWSCLVTGSGSLTLQIASQPSGSYPLIGIAEFSPTAGYEWDASRYESQNEASGASGNSSSGNVTSAGAAVFAGVEVHNSGSNSAVTEDANWALVYEAEDGTTGVEASTITRIAASGLTDDANWTLPSNFGWVAGAACFKETSTGADYGTPRDHDGVWPFSSIWRPARV